MRVAELTEYENRFDRFIDELPLWQLPVRPLLRSPHLTVDRLFNGSLLDGSYGRGRRRDPRSGPDSPTWCPTFSRATRNTVIGRVRPSFPDDGVRNPSGSLRSPPRPAAGSVRCAF